MTTVGYGDLFPRTVTGRFIIFIVSIWGVFVVSLMVLVLTETLKPTNEEEHSYAVLARLSLREDLV